jgi:hypothetical protein
MSLRHGWLLEFILCLYCPVIRQKPRDFLTPFQGVLPSDEAQETDICIQGPTKGCRNDDDDEDDDDDYDDDDDDDDDLITFNR